MDRARWAFVWVLGAVAAWAGAERPAAGEGRTEPVAGRDALVALRAKMAADGVLGRPGGLKRERAFAATLAKDPALAAEVLYDVACAEARNDPKDALETLTTLLETHPKVQPWATLAAYDLARLHAAREATRPKSLPLFQRYLASDARDPVRTARALLELARLEAEAGKRDEALARLRAFLDRFPGFDQLRADALSRIGRILVDTKQWDDAAATYKTLTAEYPSETEARSGLLFAIIQAHRSAENSPAALAACEQYLADFAVGTVERSQVYVALTTLHGQQKNADAAAATYRRMLDDKALPAAERVRARQYLFAHYRRVGDQAALVRQAHELIAAGPVAAADTEQLLGSLVDALIEAGRVDEAIALARADFRLSQLTPRPERPRSGRSSTEADDPIFTVVRALKAKEGGLRTANAFVQFLATGPEGADAKLGTADDVADPLAAFALPAEPERDKLFGEAAQRFANEPLERGCLCLFWDKPVEALRAFRLHYLRATTSADLKAAATVLAQALRAVGRPETEVDAFFNFQNYGPDGPDGKPKTADDLKDPILELK
jgi:predicted negative regulator of RcsB-dependent stress response